MRSYIADTYGKTSLPKEARRFKVGKAAQEAHEAIRPTLLEFAPDSVKASLGRDEFRLYQLIWNRFVASQMETAMFDTTRADIEAGDVHVPRHRLGLEVPRLARRLPRRERRRRAGRRRAPRGRRSRATTRTAGCPR